MRRIPDHDDEVGCGRGSGDGKGSCTGLAEGVGYGDTERVSPEGSPFPFS